MRGVATTAGGYVAARIPGASERLQARAERRAKAAPAVDPPYEPALVTQVELTEGARPSRTSIR